MAGDIVNTQPNTFFICIIPIFFWLLSVYIWFSPLSVSSNFVVKHYLDTYTTLLENWTKNMERCTNTIQDLRPHINTGFELMDTFTYLEAAFGKLLFVEFLECYSCLIFSTFFGSSVIYQCLRQLGSHKRRLE